MMKQLNTPKFQNEAEEAEWWKQNEDLLFQHFEEASTDNSFGHGTLARRGLVSLSSIQLDSEDMKMAQEQAATRGLRYQHYIKTVLHEALLREAISDNPQS